MNKGSKARRIRNIKIQKSKFTKLSKNKQTNRAHKISLFGGHYDVIDKSHLSKVENIDKDKYIKGKG